MSYLEFIFSSFWVFCGCAFLLGIGLQGVAEIVRAFRRSHD